jgi:hypothetical protein
MKTYLLWVNDFQNVNRSLTQEPFFCIDHPTVEWKINATGMPAFKTVSWALLAETVAPSCSSPYRCLSSSSSLAAQASQCGPFQFSRAEIRFDASNKPVFPSAGNPLSSAHMVQAAQLDEGCTAHRPIVSVWSLFELVKLASRLHIRSSGMLNSALW